MKRIMYVFAIGFLICLLALSACGKKKDNGQVLITTPLGDNITDDTLENLETCNPQPSIPEITETDVPEIDSDTAMRMYQAKLESSTDEDLILELAKITGSDYFIRLSVLNLCNGSIDMEEFISVVPELKGAKLDTAVIDFDDDLLSIMVQNEEGLWVFYTKGISDIFNFDSEHRFNKFERDIIYIREWGDSALISYLGKEKYFLSSAYYLDIMNRDFIYLCSYDTEDVQNFPGFYDRIFKEENGVIEVDVCGLLFLRDAKYNLDLILQNNTLSIDKKVDSIYDGIFCSELYTDAEKINLAGNAISYFDNIEKNSEYKTYQVNGKTLLEWAKSLQVQSISEIEQIKAKDIAIIEAARESYVPVG